MNAPVIRERSRTYIKYLWAGLNMILLSHTAFSQIPVEILAGHNQLQHEFFFFKDIDQGHKVNLFSMARFAVDYDDTQRNTTFVSSQATYNLNQRWGVTGGALIADGTFAPLVAVSFVHFNKKKDLFINLFPTMILKEKPEYELFGLLLYTPKITDNLSFFSQVIFGTTYNHNFSQHLFSYQQIRLGIGIKDWFQTGFGMDQNLIGPDFAYTNNIGIFLRKEL